MKPQGGIMPGMQKSLGVNVGNVTVKVKLSRKEYDRLYNQTKRKLLMTPEKRKSIYLRNKKWSEENRLKLRQWYKNKYNTDIQYMLAVRMRARINHVLNGKNKSEKTKKLLGCSYIEFKKYIESKFKPGMSWKNKHLFHIDHIRPCSSFDLTDPQQQAQCFHYTNLQPLWSKENLSKGAKW